MLKWFCFFFLISLGTTCRLLTDLLSSIAVKPWSAHVEYTGYSAYHGNHHSIAIPSLIDHVTAVTHKPYMQCL